MFDKLIWTKCITLKPDRNIWTQQQKNIVLDKETIEQNKKYLDQTKNLTKKKEKVWIKERIFKPNRNIWAKSTTSNK